MMKNIEFAKPENLFLLLLLLPLIGWYIWQHKSYSATIHISNLQPIKAAKKTTRVILRHIPFIVRMLAIITLIIILARPQSPVEWHDDSIEGIDIILAMDVSSSMLARDFTPDRLEAAKDVAIEFINNRQNDRIGLVVFSGESYTQCPLTTERAKLTNDIKELRSGIIEDGTALGVGLANAVKRIKDSDAKSKVIILLTDGVNNLGAIEPITAAGFAQKDSIRVYTIGVGRMGTAPYPVGKNPFTGKMVYQDIPVEIDEATLRQISKMTNGEYFRATNNQKLREIYAAIDDMEKSKIKIQKLSRRKEEYLGFALIGLALIVFEFLLKITALRKIP